VSVALQFASVQVCSSGNSLRTRHVPHIVSVVSLKPAFQLVASVTRTNGTGSGQLGHTLTCAYAHTCLCDRMPKRAFTRVMHMQGPVGQNLLNKAKKEESCVVLRTGHRVPTHLYSPKGRWGETCDRALPQRHRGPM